MRVCVGDFSDTKSRADVVRIRLHVEICQSSIFQVFWGMRNKKEENFINLRLPIFRHCKINPSCLKKIESKFFISLMWHNLIFGYIEEYLQHYCNDMKKINQNVLFTSTVHRIFICERFLLVLSQIFVEILTYFHVEIYEAFT